jgi:hypothetical protein
MVRSAKTLMVLLALTMLPSCAAGTARERHGTGRAASKPTTLPMTNACRLDVAPKANRSSFAPGEAIWVTVRLTNVGEQAVKVGHSGEMLDYRLEVLAESGAAAPTVYGRKAMYGGSQARTADLLRPGESEFLTVLLNRLFDMTQSGQYRVIASHVVFVEHRAAIVRSDPLMLNIEARWTEEFSPSTSPASRPPR